MDRLPFGPRRLEASAYVTDHVFHFFSPKLRRVVTTKGASHTGIALQHEFNPWVPQYIERPCCVGTRDGDCELSFWYRTDDGAEAFQLLIPLPAIPCRKSRMATRRLADALSSASQEGMLLQPVYEIDLLDDLQGAANRYRLLPLIRKARALRNFRSLRRAIRERVASVPAVSLRRLIGSLPWQDPQDVFAVAFALVHQGVLEADLAHAIDDETEIRLRTPTLQFGSVAHLIDPQDVRL